jgi:phosphoglucosamine mutase
VSRMRKLFGTDGIRGVANVYPMNVETAVTVGKAIVRYFRKNSNLSTPHVLIGQDTRRSGDMLAHAVAAGACAAGADVWMLSVLPTPGIAHLTKATGAMAGIVISASHNPFEDNGIKVFDGQGYKLSDNAEAAIEALVCESDQPLPVGAADIGRVKTLPDAGERYLTFLQQAAVSEPHNNLSIVLDCANGATFKVAPELFRRSGFHVSSLACAPDGFNINDRCGSQHPENLAHVVAVQKADIGLAFDGDGDRLIAVDETGHILTGDQIMAVCANDLLQKGALSNKVVVSTVMSNLGFGLALEQMGIRWVATQIGDRYVMEKMKEEGAVLGGEDSGHIVFHDLHTTGDGLMAALRLLAAMRRVGKPLSELAKIMTVFPQELINVDVNSKPEIDSVPEIRQAIARAKESLGGCGRVLVRYSGTQDKCRVMVEGPTHAETHALCLRLAEVVRKAIGK